jgi:hypothetical protein
MVLTQTVVVRRPVQRVKFVIAVYAVVRVLRNKLSVVVDASISQVIKTTAAHAETYALEDWCVQQGVAMCNVCPASRSAVRARCVTVPTFVSTTTTAVHVGRCADQERSVLLDSVLRCVVPNLRGVVIDALIPRPTRPTVVAAGRRVRHEKPARVVSVC